MYCIIVEIITKLSLVVLYHYLYLEVPHFEGQCRDRSNQKHYMQNCTGSSYRNCLAECRLTNGCSAVACRETDSICVFYGGGPYTQGDGQDGVVCYPLQGNLLFFFKYFTNAIRIHL